MATVLRCLVALFAVALLRSGGPAPASAQQSGAYQQALSQLAAGDTLAALESLRLVTKDDPGFAPGWGLLGIVLTQRASSVLSDFVERRDAEAALRRALKLDSDNPLYTLGLGLLLRKQSRIHDSNRLISRALESIPRAPELLGPIELEEYHLLWRLMVLRGARQAQREFESLRRDSLAWHSQEPDCFERVGQICLSWVPPQTLCKEHESLRAARNGLIDSLRTANAAIPGGDGWITGQLVRYLVEAGRSTEALEIADLCGQAPPWWGSALAGYVYQTTGQFDRADSTFASALGAMLDDERRAWTDISILLPAASWQAYAALSRERREALERRFWWLADPLYLHPMNDRRTEHLARVMMSRLQEDAASGFAVTWGTDLEEITLRYGWPSGWVKVPKPRDRWVVMACYPDHARRFVPPPQYMPEPSLIPGPLPTNPWPLNPPVARTIYTPGYAIFRDLEHQLAVFQRGDSVEVVAAFDQTADPAWGQAMAEAAVFLVFDELTAPDVARATVRGSRGVLRLRVPASPRLLSFELYSEQREQAARARYGLRLRQVPRELFALSSLLVTSPTKPLPTSLDQAARLARGSLRVRPGERLGLYWEVYGISLQPERLQVSVVVYKLGPDGRAITGSSEAPIHLRWRETLPALATPWPRSLTLDLPADLSPGNYIVLLHVMPHRHESVRTARMVLVED